jgi:hypothetical protein
MMEAPQMTGIALPLELHRTLSTAAAAKPQSLQALVRELLTAELSAAQAHREAGERLSDRYLTDPRLVRLPSGSPSTLVDDALLDQVDDLLAVCREELDAAIPRSQLLQALLWQALDPLPPDAPRVPLPAPARHPHVTVAIPEALRTALRDLALRRGQRAEAVVADLLQRGLDEPFPPDLADDDRITANVKRGGSTIHIPRALDTRLTALAREHFGGVKGRAVQALLWRGLDQATQEAASTDRVLTLDGRLYAAIEQHLRGRRDAGDTRSVPAFVEEAVRALLALEQGEGGGRG